VVANPSRKEVYVTTGCHGHVMILDPVKNTIIGSVHVGTRPWGVTVVGR
jgi:YVTN family beta-propeller protein